MNRSKAAEEEILYQYTSVKTLYNIYMRLIMTTSNLERTIL